jgi:hypothetical protein
MAQSLPSLLMALLGPPPVYPTLPGTDSDGLVRTEVEAWMGQDKERRELMLQALYGALPYAFTDQGAARAVGRLLARAIGGEQAALEPEEADIKALRTELREGLKKRFDRLKVILPLPPQQG